MNMLYNIDQRVYELSLRLTFHELTWYFLQLSLKTDREKKKEIYFPLRKYAIKA